MNTIAKIAILVVLGVGGYVATSAIYTVSEVEQMIITQFGKPVGEPVTTAGLKFKVPFIQDVNPIDRRVLEWDGNPSDMPTKDKLYISVDLFARWRITDPLQYFLRLRDERSAQSRLDDILGSETRNAVAKHELIEIIRTTKDRTPLRDTLLTEAERKLDMGALVPIQKGRKLVEGEIFAAAAEKVRVFGIELLDIRFKRINYNESVRPKIYDRMVSERRQIAERFLSEGNGEAARIRGNRVRDLNKIQSEAYRQVEEIRGVADAKATEIYAKAYNQSQEAVEFYEFTRTMQAYKPIIADNTTMILSTDSDLFKFLKGMAPDGDIDPVQPFRRSPMTVRTSQKTVTFRRPFVLGGFDEVLPAGIYVVETDEVLVEGISFLAYRRILTLLHLPEKTGHRLAGVLTIDPKELDAALERERASMAFPASWASSHKMLKGKTESPEEKADRQAIERGEGEGMIVGSK